jgi:hypothetical protein
MKEDVRTFANIVFYFVVFGLCELSATEQRQENLGLEN